MIHEVHKGKKLPAVLGASASRPLDGNAALTSSLLHEGSLSSASHVPRSVKHLETPLRNGRKQGMSSRP